MSSGIQRSWTQGTLKDLVFFQRGFDITKADQKEGEIPVISSSGLTSYHNEAKVAGPGIIIGRKGSLGTVHFSECPYWPHDTTLWSKDIKGNNPRYIYYFLKTLGLERFDVGNSNPTLNRNHIHDMNIAIPPKGVQEGIVEILSPYDSLIENNRRRIQLLEEAARLLYQEWFIRFRFPGYEHTKIVDGVPEGWITCKISEVCYTIGGGTPSTSNPEYWGGDVVWATPTDITKNDCIFLPDTERKISQLGLKNSSAKIVPPGTILMTSRASIGFFGVMDKETSTNQGFINIIPNDPWNKWYLTYNLISRVEEIRSNASGSTYKEISKGRFREMLIVVPTKIIASEFEERCNYFFELIRNLKLQQIKLLEGRDLLLP
ncbi:MAG: restriction endonuclease subunit S, partial [Methanobacteriota archaeon]